MPRRCPGPMAVGSESALAFSSPPWGEAALEYRDRHADMLLWIAFAVLTAAVLAFVLAPLVRPVRSDADRDAGEDD